MDAGGSATGSALGGGEALTTAAGATDGAWAANAECESFWQLPKAEKLSQSSQATRVGSVPLMGAREVYQKTRKVPDLFWNRYVCRPIAAVLVSAVAGTRVTPNQITLASFVVGILSAGLLVALPGHGGLIVAVLVYQASYVLDCADGMLARWRGVASPAGHLLDFLMDELKAFALLGAAAVRLHGERPDEPFLFLGIGGLVALASGIALTSFQRHPEIAPPRGRAADHPKSLLARAVGVVESVAKFLIHYPSYILYVALAGRLEWYLYPYVAVNAAYAAKAWLGVALRFGRASA
ncbi:MAG: CDP-alcohol phosphatidyltransferase [Polyangiaceae bacterium]|nr:CDP-alcohol phosphatidyltransferase [Polyangiaceae bacterium]